MGSLSGAKWSDLGFVLIPMLCGLVPLILLRWQLNVITMGDDEARAMGVNPQHIRLAIVICSTLVTASAVSVSGMIGWVGLVIPHFCRLLFGFDYRRLIPASALMGASFLLLTDDLARILTAAELPLGILTGIVGAPVFLYLIMTGGKENA
jgi:iron complex transport system permease protein